MQAFRMSVLQAGGKRDLFYFAPAQGAQCQADRGWPGDFGDGGLCSLFTLKNFADGDVQEFIEGEFFAGELFVDEAKASFQQLGFKRFFSKQKKKKHNVALFTLLTNRFSLLRLLPRLCSSKWKNANDEAKAKGLGGNLKGDGGQTGGVLVVGQGGAPTMFTYKQVRFKIGRFLASIGPFLQEDPADHPDNASILEALGIQTQQ